MIEWVFSGIGTEIIIVLLFGLGSYFTYGYVKKITCKQEQKAGANSKLTQLGSLAVNSNEPKDKTAKGMINLNQEQKQAQKAGDNSTLLQMGSIVINQGVINQGITETRAREIFNEEFVREREKFTLEGYQKAQVRVRHFEDQLMEKMHKHKNSMECFSEPSFLLLLKESQEVAASTDCHEDYELLAELLSYRTEQEYSRTTKAAIRRAIKIVDEIDSTALCGLTIYHFATTLHTTCGSLVHGLRHLESIYSKLMTTSLPKGNQWLEHLEMLGAIRQQSTSLFGRKKAKEFFADCYEGYAVVGIAKESEKYNEALLVLQEAGLPQSLLVNNELVPGYVRINTSNQNSLAKIKIDQRIVMGNRLELKAVPITENQIQSLKKIWSMYEMDKEKLDHVRQLFESKWNEYPHLKMLSEWWDTITVVFHILLVGQALARTNARRFDTSIPELENLEI